MISAIDQNWGFIWRVGTSVLVQTDKKPIGFGSDYFFRVLVIISIKYKKKIIYYLNMFNFDIFPIDILLMASISLLGFVSVFVVFRYRTIDIYVDNKKYALRSLLNKEIEIEPMITVYIQNIGKEEDKTEELKKIVVELSPDKIEPIIEFEKQIKNYRIERIHLIESGLKSIGLWTILSIIIIFNIFSRNTIISLILILLFVIFLIYTFIIIRDELLKGYKE